MDEKKCPAHFVDLQWGWCLTVQWGLYYVYLFFEKGNEEENEGSSGKKKKAAKKARKTGVPKSISVAKSTGGFCAFQMTTGFPDTIGEIAYHEYDGVVEI